MLCWLKQNGEAIGVPILFLGFLLIFAAFILTLIGTEVEVIYLLGVALGSISVGLGFIATGMSAKSDIRHTELLERLDKNVETLPLMLKVDILTPSGQQLAKDILSKQSKAAAQKRLDEDTERVGFVRGEVYQLKDGNWGIAWGGKYPL